MPTLLSLARELRDQILRDAVESEHAPPANPAVSVDRTGMYYRCCLQSPRLAISDIWIHEPPTSGPASSLLRVNRQLRKETADLLRSRGVNYKLDVLFVKECGLWPTWLSMPVLTRHIDTVYTQFRIFDPPENVNPLWRRPEQFRGGDGGPPTAVWAYYYLLIGLLRGGPANKFALWENVPCQYTVKTLILDVLLPDPSTDHTIMGIYFSGMGPSHDGELFPARKFNSLEEWPAEWPKPAKIDHRYTPAERLAYFLWSQLDDLARLTYYTMSYGDILYEGIGTIEVRVNGEARKTLNLTQWLKRQPINDPFGENPDLHPRRQQDFEDWKTWVEQRRKACGLGDGVTSRDREMEEKLNLKRPW